MLVAAHGRSTRGAAGMRPVDAGSSAVAVRRVRRVATDGRPRQRERSVGRLQLILGFGWSWRGGEDRDAAGKGCSLHSVVVGENPCQIATERECRGEMDRVERPQFNRSERRSGRADVIVEWNLGKRGEKAEDRVLIRDQGSRVAARPRGRARSR